MKYKCIRCGKEIEYSGKSGIATCENCMTEQAMPCSQDTHIMRLYEDAYTDFQNGEFEKVTGLYEQILRENQNDPMAHWMLLLCAYGIEYERGKLIIRRFQYDRVTNNKDYKAAIAYGNQEQKTLFENHGKEIEELRLRIEGIVNAHEGDVDIFLSYKETDDKTGERTHDSNTADMLNTRLRDDYGYKVFYAPVSLEGKSGELFEPFIFSALHSAKVMIVIGTSIEYLNSVWIKNEWERFLPLAEESNGS